MKKEKTYLENEVMRMNFKPIMINKKELKKYLGIGDIRLSKLFRDPNFPQENKVIRKWRVSEVDKYFDQSCQNEIVDNSDWRKFA